MNNIRYTAAVTAIKLIKGSGFLNLTEEDYDFLTTDKPWISQDRSRARQCVEAAVYGTLDFMGFTRFNVSAEFISGAIAYYVHPTNLMTACLIMEGAEWSENIINGIERPVAANELFAHVIQIKSGMEQRLDLETSKQKTKFKELI